MSSEVEKALLRLFAESSVLYLIPTNEGLLGFIDKLIGTIPGVSSHELCLVDKERPNELNSKLLGKQISKNNAFDLSDYYLLCEKIDKTIYIYPIKTTTFFYGFIAIKACNKKFDKFESVANNFVISLCLILEKREDEKNLIQINNELEEHKKHLNFLVKKRTSLLEESRRKLATTLEKTIEALAITVELRDPYTAGHQLRVAKLSEAIAMQLKLSTKITHAIYLGALIHDIGKIQIPQEILTTPIQLNQLQWEYIKTHPEAGYKIIQSVPLGATISDIILHHHERIDGSGYPHGLKGNEIPLTTKIVSVADAFEAMSSHRPYRPRYSVNETLSELKHDAGRLYDPSIVACCVKLITEYGFVLPSLPKQRISLNTDVNDPI